MKQKKQKVIIYILNKKGEPLMPTTRCRHVRILLDNKKAVVVSSNPFTIRLKYDTPNGVQNVFAGIDSGRENIGSGASNEGGDCLYLGELKTSNKSIKMKMTERAGFRRERRRHDRQNKQRKAKKDHTEIQNGDDDVCRTTISCKSVQISYPTAEESVTHKIIRGKEGKFANRHRDEGWITPSARQLIQMHMNDLKSMCRILPISHVTLERVAFDFQKLENENIKAWEYGKGKLYGYNSPEEYIRDVQDGKCLVCGKPHIDYLHHIIPRSKGGSDKVSNLVGLCYDCHYGPTGVHKCQDTQDRLPELKNKANKQYKVSLLNSVMPVLIEEMDKFCKANSIIFSICEGHDTAKVRDMYDLQKDHCLDGFAISLVGRDVESVDVMPDRIYQKQRYKKKSKNIIQKRNHREYYAGKKLVAVNRHKGTDQKTDSLEEYMNTYAESHTADECKKHFESLTVKPARRTYTFHKEWRICPFHIGDKVRYEKKNKVKGNTKVETFICESIYFSKDENKAKVEHNKTKSKKMKFCRVLESGCIPYIDYRKLALI